MDEKILTHCLSCGKIQIKLSSGEIKWRTGVDFKKSEVAGKLFCPQCFEKFERGIEREELLNVWGVT